MSLLENVQDYLTERPDFPQKHFDGEHELDIQRLDPDHDYTQAEITLIVGAVIDSDEADDISSAICDLVRDRINVLTGNAARTEKLRAPKIGSSQNKAWNKAIKTKNLEHANKMYDAFVLTADAFDITDQQLANYAKELNSIS